MHNIQQLYGSCTCAHYGFFYLGILRGHIHIDSCIQWNFWTLPTCMPFTSSRDPSATWQLMSLVRHMGQYLCQIKHCNGTHYIHVALMRCVFVVMSIVLTLTLADQIHQLITIIWNITLHLHCIWSCLIYSQLKRKLLLTLPNVNVVNLSDDVAHMMTRYDFLNMLEAI